MDRSILEQTPKSSGMVRQIPAALPPPLWHKATSGHHASFRLIEHPQNLVET
jgi:hypothetical protein